MSSLRLVIDLFCEDHAHEALLKPLLTRLCRAAGVQGEVRVRSARGGRPRVLAELEFYQRVVLGAAPLLLPDLLVAAVDANCTPHAKAVSAVTDCVDPRLRGHLVAACPDPHIERWYLADPEALRRVVGAAPRALRRKCERGYYKKQLAATVARAGRVSLLGGIDFAEDLAGAMDLARAERGDVSLRRFLREASRAIAALVARRERLDVPED